MDDLLEVDRRRHVWHPYGPMPAATPPLRVVSAAGVRLELADGRELVDGMASWWCAIHGYRHPVLDAAVREQLDRMAHVMFGGLTHEPAIRLARRLTDWTGLDHVFFADSGSVAVEVAIKLVMQAWHGERTKLLTWRGSYHGDTFGAMAVCDPEGGMHSMWGGLLTEHVFAPAPRWDDEWIADVRAIFDEHELAGVIVEPIVQGAGGMRFHPPECVALLRELCDEHGLFLILDEIATGFGRTGELFAAAGLADVLCLGKALTGGYMTLAASGAARRALVVVARAGLGTLNHTALTVEAIQRRGLRCLGIVIGLWPREPDLAARCNLDDLERIAPVLGKLPEGSADLNLEIPA